MNPCTYLIVLITDANESFLGDLDGLWSTYNTTKISVPQLFIFKVIAREKEFARYRCDMSSFDFIKFVHKTQVCVVNEENENICPNELIVARNRQKFKIISVDVCKL